MTNRNHFRYTCCHEIRDRGYDRFKITSTFQPGRDTKGTRIRLSTTGENNRLMQERLGMSTAEIGLSVRTTNCLEERGIFTVRDLLNCTPADLLDISNFGEKTLEEVYDALAKIGFERQSLVAG